MELGCTLTEILEADSLAHSLRFKFKPTAKKSPSLTLSDMILQTYTAFTPRPKRTSQEPSKPLTEAQLKEIATQTGRSVADIKASQGKIVGSVLRAQIPPPQGLQ